MAHSHMILPDLDLAYLCYSGHVTLEDQQQLIAEVVAHPLHRFDLRKLSDSAGMTGTDLGFASTMTLHATLKRAYAGIDGPVLWAQYTPGDVGFGMARILQTLCTDLPMIEMEIFREPGPALAFLGLSARDLAGRIDLAASCAPTPN